MKKLFILTNNHFDPTWRRCFDRRIVDRGREFVSYAEIEAFYIEDNLRLARRHKGYRFEVESPLVLRRYLEAHTRRLTELRRLAREGRFTVSGVGDNIVDANLVLGESLVRNFVAGLLWVESTLGRRTALGLRNDGFGNSAQLPQILRGCGLRWATGFSYSPVKGRFWRGLDGSVVCTAFPPVVSHGGWWRKYAPCPACAGKGCHACAGRGIETQYRSELPGPVAADRFRDSRVGLVSMCPEELLPNPGIVRWAREAARRYDVRFALHEDVYPFVEKWVAQADNPPAREVHPSVELNPNNSGTWVTRIRLKQALREREYALLGTESLCAAAALAGAAYPSEKLTRIWRDLFFTMFHDAVTATHVDAAYDELQDINRRIGRETADVRRRALARLTCPDRQAVSVVNPFGQAATQLAEVEIPARQCVDRLEDESGRAVDVVERRCLEGNRCAIRFVARGVPPLGVTTYRLVRSERPAGGDVVARKRPVIRNRRFRVEADEHGIRSVYDRKFRRDVLRAGLYRPNEFILEHDEGSPWATLGPDRTRYPLAAESRLKRVEAGPGFQRMVFEICPGVGGKQLTNVGCFQAVTTVTLYEGMDRVDFETETTWDSHNLRVRIAMPTTARGKGIFGIPYGMLERKPYPAELGLTRWASANGDWPTVNWAGVEGRGLSVALLNRGVPSYLHEKGTTGDTLFLSVLRSPAVPTYLHEPPFYSMTGFDGMRDAGRHRFAYAVTAYDTPFADSDIVADSEGFNAGLLGVAGRANLPGVPSVHSDHVRLAALKWAEEGSAVVVRLVEYRGRRGTVVVEPSAGVRRVSRVNLLEREAAPLAMANGRVRFTVRPWEIATLRLEFER